LKFLLELFSLKNIGIRLKIALIKDFKSPLCSISYCNIPEESTFRVVLIFEINLSEIWRIQYYFHKVGLFKKLF